MSNQLASNDAQTPMHIALRNNILRTPKHITTLATSAILISVDITVWTGTARDKGVSDEVADAKKANRDTVDVTKRLLAGVTEHRDLIKNRQTIYNWLELNTYEWAGGLRLLPNARLARVMDEWNNVHLPRTQQLIEAFLLKYPSIVSDAAFRQGDMFNRDDFPSVDTLRNKFGVKLFRMPVPSNHFTIENTREAIEDATLDYERQTREYVDNVMSKMAADFAKVMTSLRDTCAIEQVTDDNGQIKTKRRKLHDTTINKALEMCETFKQFNLTDDSKLEQARSALETALSSVNIEALKASDALRHDMHEEVDDILKAFKL